MALNLLPLRKEAGLSQAQLAEAAGIHHSYVSLLERELRTPSVHHAIAIADALSQRLGRTVTVVEVFGRDRPQRGKTA